MEHCYICGKKLTDKETPMCALRHKEHIIHNGIGGRLKSSKILCQKCGGEYSKDDAEFVNLFKVFLELLKRTMYSKDHGTNKDKRLLGYLKILEEEKKEVISLNGRVFPTNPYYTIDEDTKIVRIYAEKQRAKQYENIFRKEHPEYDDYVRELISDINDQGELGLFFSEGNSDFNTSFRNGFVKIATEFALDNGIDRKELPNSLIINTDDTCTFDASRTTLIPYKPSSAAEMITELIEDVVNSNYPSHELRLYSENAEYRRVLICYISLFSTFRYYILLNNNYMGADIDVTHAQRLLVGTDKDGNPIDPIYDLSAFLNKLCGDIYNTLNAFFKTHTLPNVYDAEMTKKIIDTTISDEGLEQFIREMLAVFDYSNYRKNIVYFYDDAEPSVISLFKSCYETAKKDIDIIRLYTNFKFNQLNRFCWTVKQKKNEED